MLYLEDGAEPAAAEEVGVGEAARGGLEHRQVHEQAPLLPFPRQPRRRARGLTRAPGLPPPAAAPAHPRPRQRRARSVVRAHLPPRRARKPANRASSKAKLAAAAQHLY